MDAFVLLSNLYHPRRNPKPKREAHYNHPAVFERFINMAGNQQKHSKSTLNAAKQEDAAIRELPEKKKKQLELGDAMEHEHGRKRESLEEDIQDLDTGSKR
jgi:hypothetical protein